MKYPNENVLVVPSKAIKPLLKGEFTHGTNLFRDVINACGTYMNRNVVEENDQWQQIIPYMVLRRGVSYYLLRRLATQGEARLHNKCSFGVGGHVTEGDSKYNALVALDRGAQRELDEEVFIDGNYNMQEVGVIHDATNAVGSVHLGLLSIVDVFLSANVQVREKDKMVGEWIRADQINADSKPMFETWSWIFWNNR